MCGQMARPTLETGTATRCMAKELYNGQTVRNTMDNSKTINAKGEESLLGEMEEYTTVSGQMESNTEEELSLRWMELKK